MAVTRRCRSAEDRVDQLILLYASTKKVDELMSESYAISIACHRRLALGLWPVEPPDVAMWLFTEAITAGGPINVLGEGKHAPQL